MKNDNNPIEELFEILNFKEVYNLILPYTEDVEFLKWSQLAINSKCGNNLFDGCGSLYDESTNSFVSHTGDFDKINNVFINTQVEELVNLVNEVSLKQFKVKIGRIRLMRLKKKSCYTLHRDPEEFRFHIPLKSNEKCFFVIEDQICRMNKVGSLYKFKTNSLHTAINASNEFRDHLVFDTY